MKKVLLALAMIVAVPAFAAETSTTPEKRESFVGMRVHKNIDMNFELKFPGGGSHTMENDQFGIGFNIGTKINKYFKWDYELGLTGSSFNDLGADISYFIISNMATVYGGYQFENGIEPYIGIGAGLSVITGNIDAGNVNITNVGLGLSYQVKLGVAYAINDRFGLDFGVKYINYGGVKHTNHGYEIATTYIDATEFYVGGVYKF